MSRKTQKAFEEEEKDDTVSSSAPIPGEENGEENSALDSKSWPLVRSLCSRQLGLICPVNFTRDASGSVGLLQRMKLQNKLAFHEGCVNTLHFSQSGDLLASGSDDLAIAIWDWSKGKKKLTYKSGHTSNVFQVG